MDHWYFVETKRASVISITVFCWEVLEIMGSYV